MVRGAAEGRMPSWFAATYHGANGEPDLERLWADVKGISASKSRAATVFQLRNEFGGYCDRRKATDSAFENGVTRNPWRDGGCVPAAPRDVAATAVGGGKLTVSWDPPDDDGGSPIEGYKVQWKSGTEAYDSSRQAEVTDLERLSHTIDSLTSGVDHSVRVVAYNHNGGGADSVETTATAGAQDMTAPQLSAATADGASLVLTWNETLDETSVPLPGAFEVSAGGTARGIGRVSVTGDRVTLTLTSAVAVGEAVTLSYAVPAGANASPLRDTAMNAAASLSGREVRNDTTAVTIVSDPGTDLTYIFHYGYGSQDVIELTVTFSERVTVTGVPELALQVGSVTKQAAYAGGSGTTALTFRYVVVEGDTDPNGVSVPAGHIGGGGTIKYFAGNDAAPARVSLAAQPGHKVDGVRPALVSVRAVANGNVLTLTWDKVLDENSVPGWGDNRGFFLWDVVDGQTSGPPRDEITAVSISGAVVTLDLSSTVQSGAQLVVSYTVPYKTYPPLLDTLGNYAGNNKVEIAIAASESSNTPPTGLPAISGTAQVGDTLTGSADEIVDADGLQNAEFAWQWLTNDGTADADIAGATAATYTLTAADLGKTIKVRVSFTDDGGTEETLVSAVTVAVAETQPPVPEITFGGGFTVDEGETKVATLTMQETGKRGSDSVWSIPKGTDGGEDADAFTLNPDGTLSFRTAKDYESPDDADGDGEYEVTVQFGTKTANASADLVISLRNVNEAPVADAGADIAGVSPGATVTLDGSGSSDPDMDDTLTWLWTQTDASGYPVVLSDAAAKRPTFTVPSDIAADAVLVFTLRVTDAGGLFAEDSVRVSVAPPPTDAPAAPTEVLWSADVTVTDYGGAFGAITADSFTNVTGDELGVEWIWYSVGVRRLDLILSEAATDAGELTLHLDDVALAFPQGSSGESTIRWRPIRLSWKNGQTVAARLSRTSQAPEPVNTSPTGLPAIAGTPRVGEALRASVSGIADADGLSGATFTYQWIRSDGTTDTDIADATQVSYTLVAADQGKTIKVRATFIDDGGTEETLTSVATAVVQDSLTLSVSDARATEGALVEFTVSLSAASSQQVTVQYATSGVTAQSGTDFTAASGTLTFAANETSKTVSVATTADAADEDNETFTLTLSSPTNAVLGDATATGTIVNDDEPEDTVSPTVSVQCVDLEASPFDTQSSDFASISSISLWWELHFSEPVRSADGTGVRHSETAGQDDTDYAGWTIGVGSGSFYYENGHRYHYRQQHYMTPKVPRPDGSPSAVVSDVNGVVITIPAGGWQDRSGNLNTASANSLYLAHNWKVSVADASATEGTDGTIDFEVTLNARDDCETVTVDWATADGTATAGEDYTAANGTLTFGPGETSKTLSVVILDDTVEESGETFTLQLSNASGVTLADAEATGTISDEQSPFVSVPQIDGVPQVGNTLEVSFAEPPSGALAYQWLRGSEVIAGATASTYVPTVADVGARLSVRVESGGETRTSAATAPVEATVPDAPRSLALAVPDGREGVVQVSWAAPSSNGGSALTGYKVQWRSGSEEYDGTVSSTRQATVTELANLTHTITGLTNGVAYTVRVIATNGVGDGAATAEATRTPGDRVRPELATAVVNGETLTLTWSEALDEGSEPAAEAFAVSVAGVARGVTDVAVAGSAVTLTLASAVTADDAVTVSYTVPVAPDAPRLEDAAGNAAAAFSGEAVTNNTAAAVNTPPTGLPTISGAAHVGETLLASESGIADADGLSGATFAWQWISNRDTDISGATEASYTLDAADAGKTVKVRVTFTDDGGTAETLVSAATEPVAIPLTARFENVPETHDGSTRFTFDLRFSEEIAISYKTLRDQSLEVAGGAVKGARRLARPSNMSWRITVKPNVEGDITITLPADRACDTTGAICTSGGKRLSNRLKATVAGPASSALPEVSIVAQTSLVTEGAAAVFTLTRSGSPSAALTVDVAVTESRAMLKGAPPASVTFAAGAGTAALTVETDDDGVDEPASTITAAVSAGDGHTVDATAASAAVTVNDDDAAPVVATASPIAATENGTAVATLAAAVADTPAAELAWSIAGGADADKFTLTGAGVLAFKAAPDFEAPDDVDTDGSYEVTVRVTDGVNAVETALVVRLSDIDEIAPTLSSATVNGTALTLTFSEILDETSTPAAGAFAVTVGTASRAVSGVSVSGSAAVLTLASAVAAGDTVTVGYTVPAGVSGPRIRDAAGNAAAGFAGEAVTNATPAHVNTAPTGLPAISGAARVSQTLTASASGIADEDGLSGATFAWQWIANDGSADVEIAGATGATYTLTAAEVGKTVKVQVTFTDDGGTEETLVSAATGQVSAALTARFENVPERHDGATVFAVRIAFSEAVTTGFAALRDHAAEITGGTVTGARRSDGRGDLWELSVEPGSDAEVTVALPADRACDAAGALCTADGGRLSNRPEATIAGPLPAVSIAAGTSPVTEGTAAAFTLSRSGDTAAALTVAVVVAEDGAALKGTSPARVTFAAGAGSAGLAVATDDDETAESASTVTATVEGGDGYAVDADAAFASVTVEDDDDAPVVTTATPIDAPENGTTVATLVATDADTPAANSRGPSRAARTRTSSR